MTTIAERELETKRVQFLAHVAECEKCNRWRHANPSTLIHLCYFGTTMYRELLEAEEVIFKSELAKKNRGRQKPHKTNIFDTFDY